MAWFLFRSSHMRWLFGTLGHVGPWPLPSIRHLCAGPSRSRHPGWRYYGRPFWKNTFFRAPRILEVPAYSPHQTCFLHANAAPVGGASFLCHQSPGITVAASGAVDRRGMIGDARTIFLGSCWSGRLPRRAPKKRNQKKICPVEINLTRSTPWALRLFVGTNSPLAG